MNCIAVQIIALIVLLLQTVPSNKVVGKWKTVEDTNGYNFILEFFDNGACAKTMTMDGVGTYKVKGNRIHFNSVRMGSEVREFRIDRDTLFLYVPHHVQKFIRQNKLAPDALPIVGIWKTDEAFGNEQKFSTTMEFTKSGRSRTYVELERKVGSYEISGDMLTMKIDGDSTEQRFSIEKGFLIFDDGGSEGKFRKIRK